MSIDLAARLVSGDTSSDVLEWIRAGMARYLKDGSLDGALGLDRASALRERNAALTQAATLLEIGDSPWAVAGRLAGAIRRFETRVLPRMRRGDQVDLSPLDECIARVFATRQRIPRTQRKLYELVR